MEADLVALYNDAETALAKYGNDTTAVAGDQTKISLAQAQLTTDQAVQKTDGTDAYVKVGSLIAALQEAQAGLPAPAPVVVVVG